MIETVRFIFNVPYNVVQGIAVGNVHTQAAVGEFRQWRQLHLASLRLDNRAQCGLDPCRQGLRRGVASRLTSRIVTSLIFSAVFTRITVFEVWHAVNGHLVAGPNDVNQRRSYRVFRNVIVGKL
jgi:hypothetical protein